MEGEWWLSCENLGYRPYHPKSKALLGGSVTERCTDRTLTTPMERTSDNDNVGMSQHEMGTHESVAQLIDIFKLRFAESAGLYLTSIIKIIPYLCIFGIWHILDAETTASGPRADDDLPWLALAQFLLAWPGAWRSTWGSKL